MAIFIHFGNRTVVCRGNNRVARKRRDDWIRGIANPRRIRRRCVQKIWPRGRNLTASTAYAAPISHEGDRTPINGEVQGQLRLRAEAGYNPIGGDGKSSQVPSVRRQIVKKNGSRNAEAAVGIGIVP